MTTVTRPKLRCSKTVKTNDFSLLSQDPNDQLRIDFHGFAISCILWVTLGVDTGLHVL